MSTTLKNILSGALIAVSCFAMQALPTDHFAANSKLSTGKWVKIKVSQSGMHQITYDQLRSWGFDNPARVSVFGHGGLKLSTTHTFDNSLPDDLEQTATMRTADKIIFYGQADCKYYPLDGANVNVERNIYDNDGYYFLSDTEAPQSITTVHYDKTQEGLLKAKEHYHVEMFQPDNYSFCKGGSYWFGPSLMNGATVNVSLPVKQFTSSYFLNRDVYFSYTFGVRDMQNSNVLDVTYPPSTVESKDRYANVPNSGLSLFTLSNGYARLSPQTADEFEDTSLDFSFKLASGTTPMYAALKNAWLLYPRRNELTADMTQLPMSFVGFAQRQIFQVTGPKSLEVWNISDPTNVYRYQTVYNSSTRTALGTIDYTTGKLSQTIAFDPEKQLLAPEFVEEVANQNLHGLETPEMLIITTDQFHACAEQLAEIHRANGRKVAVVRHSQILNEFSSGAQTPMAYRLMAKMFYDRDPGTFKYLLLYGPAAWDYRGYHQQFNYPLLLSFVCDKFSHLQSAATNYTTDTYFGMLEDKYVHNDIENAVNSIAVGRLNLTNLSQAYSVNDKIRRYIESPLDPDIWGRSVFLSDTGDDNRHMAQSESVTGAMLGAQPAMTFDKYFNGFAAPSLSRTTELLAKSLQRGCGVFDFAGHGNSMSFTSNQIWKMSNVVNTKYDSYPIGIFATCESFTFDYGNYDMGSSMLCMADGGTIASVGPSRKAYLIHNGPFNLAIAQALAAAKPGSTLGDAYRIGRENARISMRSNNMGLTNAMSYHLCGDPMLPLPVPEFGVRVNSLGSSTGASETEAVKVRPLDACPLSGSITRPDGSVADDFNGTAKITVYDGPVIYGSWQNIGEPKVTVSQDHTVLATFGAEVRNGQFETTLYIPGGTSDNAVNRMVITAVSPKTDSQPRRGALGVCNRLSMSSTAPAGEATAPAGAPVISEMYLGTPAFVNGQGFEAGSPVTLHAVAAAPSGIGSAFTFVGSAPSVVIDGSTAVSDSKLRMTTRPDGSQEFICQLPDNLGAGRHDLTLTVHNNLNEKSSRTLSFNIIPRSIAARLTVDESPAVDEATLKLSADADYTNATLIITDAGGNSVFTVRNCTFPYAWNLHDADSKPVPNGIYQASVVLSSPQAHGAAAPAEIVVLK